jgi:hypothetical protein
VEQALSNIELIHDLTDKPIASSALQVRSQHQIQAKNYNSTESDYKKQPAKRLKKELKVPGQEDKVHHFNAHM